MCLDRYGSVDSRGSVAFSSGIRASMNLRPDHMNLAVQHCVTRGPICLSPETPFDPSVKSRRVVYMNVLRCVVVKALSHLDLLKSIAYAIPTFTTSS